MKKINLKELLDIFKSRGTNENIKVSMNVGVKLFDKDGNLKEEEHIHNAMTTLGKYGIIDQILASPTLAKVGWMELGTGTGGTTLLNAYVSGSRVALTSKTRSNAVVTMIGDFPAGTGTGTITEAGLFNIVTQNTGDMWAYSSFTAKTKGASDVMQITWTFTIS